MDFANSKAKYFDKLDNTIQKIIKDYCYAY